jgi:hypothetical protein
MEEIETIYLKKNSWDDTFLTAFDKDFAVPAYGYCPWVIAKRRWGLENLPKDGEVVCLKIFQYGREIKVVKV